MDHTPQRRARPRLLLPALLALVAGAVGWAPPRAEATVPGTPGVPQAPSMLFTEDFQAVAGPAPITRLDAYTGASGQSYTAATQWLSGCNGWIASASQALAAPAAAAQVTDCGVQASWNNAQQLARALGVLRGQTLAASVGNFAVSEMTFTAPGANRVELQTAANVPTTVANRFLSFSADVAAINCATSAPTLQFALLDGAGTPINLGAVLNACTTANTITIPALGTAPAITADVATFTPNGAALVSGSSFGLRVTSTNGTNIGNDHAIDNLQVLDVTPQLDKSFSPTVAPAGGTSTLTLTVTNTTELAAKNGWGFTDTLPAGLTITTPAATTTCPTTSISAPTGGSAIAVTSGDLTAGMASCTITVNVTSSAAATYTNDAARISSIVGINPPGSTSVTFVAAPSCSPPVVYTSSGSPTVLQRLVQGAGNSTSTPIGGASGWSYGGLALHPTTGALYAVSGNNGNPAFPAGHLLLIAGDGSVNDLGLVTGIPAAALTPAGTAGDGINAGSFDAAGNYRVSNTALGASARLFTIDLTTRVGTVVGTGAPAVGDFAPLGTNLYWGVVNGGASFQRINSSTGAVTNFATTLLPAGTYGSVWTYPNGNLGVRNDATGAVFQISVGTPTTTPLFNLIGQVSGQPVTSSDATACPSAAVDLAVTKTGTPAVAQGGQVTWTVTVSNMSAIALDSVQIVETTFTGSGAAPDMSGCAATIRTLAAWETRSCTATYLVTAADAARGEIGNTAVARGVGPGGIGVESLPSWVRATIEGARLPITGSNSGALVTLATLMTLVGLALAACTRRSQDHVHVAPSNRSAR